MMSAPLIKYEKPLLPGRLLRRYKRFLADVELVEENGRTVTVHVPNSGSMTGCSEPGSEVLVSTSDNPSRKLRFTLELVRVAEGPDGWAGVNTMLPNRLVAAAVAGALVPELAGYRNLRREVVFEAGSRLDLMLEDDRLGKAWVEVKNVTLVEKSVAYFPDAVTVRGWKHLEVLEHAVKEGHRGVMFFLLQHPGGDYFCPAEHIDPAYSASLRRAISCGVEVLAYRSLLSREGVSLAGPVNFKPHMGK
jgi:sugar fermentation stimulation protein A